MDCKKGTLDMLRGQTLRWRHNQFEGCLARSKFETTPPSNRCPMCRKDSNPELAQWRPPSRKGLSPQGDERLRKRCFARRFAGPMPHWTACSWGGCLDRTGLHWPPCAITTGPITVRIVADNG